MKVGIICITSKLVIVYATLADINDNGIAVRECISADDEVTTDDSKCHIQLTYVAIV